MDHLRIFLAKTKLSGHLKASLSVWVVMYKGLFCYPKIFSTSFSWCWNCGIDIAFFTCKTNRFVIVNFIVFLCFLHIGKLLTKIIYHLRPHSITCTQWAMRVLGNMLCRSIPKFIVFKFGSSFLHFWIDPVQCNIFYQKFNLFSWPTM